MKTVDPHSGLHRLAGDEPPADTSRAAQACRNVKPRSRKTTKPTGKVAVLDDAMKLRQSLRDTISSVNDLIQSIKTERRQNKLLRDTVSSLRKLQNI